KRKESPNCLLQIEHTLSCQKLRGRLLPLIVSRLIKATAQPETESYGKDEPNPCCRQLLGIRLHEMRHNHLAIEGRDPHTCEDACDGRCRPSRFIHNHRKKRNSERPAAGCK